jgi:uncharacterized protein (TIGR02118 family)
MIMLSVLYPVTKGADFDHDYYVTTHVPLVTEIWGLPDNSSTIEKGVSGPYVAAVHFVFEDVEKMNAARSASRSAEVRADVPNYTTIQPVMQISEIVGGSTRSPDRPVA